MKANNTKRYASKKLRAKAAKAHARNQKRNVENAKGVRAYKKMRRETPELAAALELVLAARHNQASPSVFRNVTEHLKYRIGSEGDWDY